MTTPDFFPQVSQYDVQQAAQLIYQASAPPTAHATASEQSRLQHEVFEIQKRPEAWSLIIPFLENEDPNVQFFGAHTAQVKIARDWDSVPAQNAEQVRDLFLELAGRSITLGRNKIILRKLFVALTSLALKLVPGHPTRWPDWIVNTVTSFSQRGCSVEHILDFLTITGEEIQSADVLGSSKMQMQQSLKDAIPMVLQAITSILAQPSQTVPLPHLQSAFKCLEAWIVLLPTSDITPLIPILITLLGPSTDDAFMGASYALQEIMTKSALSDGAGTRTLTEPLLLWLDQWGTVIAQQPPSDPVPHSLCKLLVALGDHSTSYFAEHLSSNVAVSIPQGSGSPPKTRGHLTQMFLKLLLLFTGLQGYYGEDEEQSEMTLGFWYLFQEALWSSDYYLDQEGNGVELDTEGNEVWGKDAKGKEEEKMEIAKAVYSELVQVLRRKVRLPPADLAVQWSKDQIDAFQVYRRDVGDTLLNAYYVLRSDLLAFYVNDLSDRLAPGKPRSWEEIEATLHCLMSIQEGVPLDDCPYLCRLFSAEILGQLPTAGPYRVRRTAVSLIGTYATWFTTQPKEAPPGQQTLLMNSIGFVVNALSEPVLCLAAANALQELCDANRAALAPHIGAFGTLHSGLTSIPDTEKSKVLQSIANVIQALPPQEEIAPVEAIVIPVVDKMQEAILSSSQLPDEARALIVLQLETLTGVAKGLTRNQDPMQLLEDEGEGEEPTEGVELKQAREDPRMIHLRDRIFNSLKQSVEIWSADAGVSKALSDFFKAITSLPFDTTLLTLPAGPLLELVCLAVQRSINAVWLSLAGILIMQLNPPKFFPSTFKSTGPDASAYQLVGNVLPIVLQSSLEFLGRPGSMVENTDIVQDFFGCMDTVAKNFVASFYRLPPGMFNALMQCSASSLALQERYSLVAACNFLGTLLNKTFLATTSPVSSPTSSLPSQEPTEPGELPRLAYQDLIQAHGREILRAVLAGLSGVSPRSSTQNLMELLSVMMSRCGDQCRVWIREILFAPDFVPSKATAAQKEKFIKQVLETRSLKRTREAVNEYVLVSRGLDGTSFGYSSVHQGPA
jgi:hypothetical protein